MASWVTHLIIADKVMNEVPMLDRRGFCVGNIAPDCNVENEDWTVFTPSREITHWMSGKKKVMSDSERFLNEYVLKHRTEIKTDEHYSFLLGYYAHLIADASFQWYIRDEERVKSVWKRIKNNRKLYERAIGYPENWDTVKIIIPVKARMNEIHTMEAEYLKETPESGYITEILTLKAFPDYIDYLPHGCIVRKIGIMGYMPKADKTLTAPVALSRNEFKYFADSTAELIINKFKMNNLL